MIMKEKIDQNDRFEAMLPWSIRRHKFWSIRSYVMLMDSKHFSFSSFHRVVPYGFEVFGLELYRIDSHRFEPVDSNFIDSTHIDSSQSIRTSWLLKLLLFWFTPTSELRPVSRWISTNIMNFSILDSDELRPCIVELDRKIWPPFWSSSMELWLNQQHNWLIHEVGS